MQNIQEIFNRIQVVKKKQKDIKSSYREVLKQNGEYQEIEEKIKTLRASRKQIEAAIRTDFSADFTKLDDFKIDLASDNELLADAALSTLMKGETVEVKDEYENTYQPVFAVRFKKLWYILR